MNGYQTVDPRIYQKVWTNEVVEGLSLLDMNEKIDYKSDKKILSFMIELNETEQMRTLVLKDRYHFDSDSDDV
jgi:hypothetical protein